MLAQIGVRPHDVVSADIDETPKTHELPRELAVRLAESKARTVYNALDDKDGVYVLAADTVVACGRRILDKAEVQKDAETYLNLLSGRRHRVYGGIALICPDSGAEGKGISRVCQTARN